MKPFVTLLGAGIALSACGSGLEFNGDSNKVVNSAPRSTPIPFFPLPIYLFDSVDNKYEFFVDYDNDGYNENIFQFGRSANGGHTDAANGGNQALENNELPGDAPDFANPVTPPIPLSAGAFWVRNNTDGFVVIHDVIDVAEFPPDVIPDHLEYHITGFSASYDNYHAAMTSITSQWFLQAVDGIPRVEGGVDPDEPNAGDGLINDANTVPETFVYEGASFLSIPVSFAWGGNGPGWWYEGGAPYEFNVPAPNNTPPEPVGVQKVYPINTAAPNLVDAKSSQQNKVDQRVVVKEDKDDVTDPIITKNDSAQRFPLAEAIIPDPNLLDPDINLIYFDVIPSVVDVPPWLIYAGWKEVNGENLFIDCSYGDLQDAPVPLYYTSTGVLDVAGGIYSSRTVPSTGIGGTFTDGFTIPAYAYLTQTTDAQAFIESSYYTGAIFAQMVGSSIGFPDAPYASPGTGGGGEDLMSVTIPVDQVYYVAAKKLLQFTASTLLIAQDTSTVPLDSDERDEATVIGDADALASGSIYLKETAPGPRRQAGQ
ncbi:MAG: hypothetical protein HUU29_06465 [Planctomycetaceae bacterium]|nr:hypothetical protein [Planctomycetaceae bacterium]